MSGDGALLCVRCGAVLPPDTARCPTDQSRLAPDLRGRVLDGRYRLDALIGIGGMGGSVWRGEQVSTRRAVAIKLLPGADDEEARRFERGAQIASHLNHPHIVTVHDYGQTPAGELYVVMELLEGSDLSARISGGRALALEVALRVADHTLQALAHAHRHRVVHRDLKPGNLFVVERPGEPMRVKILDFGIARLFADDLGVMPEGLDGDVTTVHKLCGTPHYMAPEQIAGGELDGRVDLYALSMVLYRVLAGRPAFTGRGLEVILRQQLAEAPPPLCSIRPDLPATVEAVVHKGLRKDREARYADADEMRAVIGDLRIELGFDLSDISIAQSASWASVSRVTPAPAPSPRRWGAAAAVLVGLAGLGAAGAWWAMHRGAGPEVTALDALVEPGAAAIEERAPAPRRPAPPDAQPEHPTDSAVDAVPDARPGDARPSDARPSDARPSDTRPSDARPGETPARRARPAPTRRPRIATRRPTVTPPADPPEAAPPAETETPPPAEHLPAEHLPVAAPTPRAPAIRALGAPTTSPRPAGGAEIKPSLPVLGADRPAEAAPRPTGGGFAPLGAP